jgi:hypothetical protein
VTRSDRYFAIKFDALEEKCDGTMKIFREYIAAFCIVIVEGVRRYGA